jgi:histidine triad (HIT) family protein
MMLAMPKRHITQQELWKDLGKVGEAAARIGEEHCPDGFRLISNTGRDAMQSQHHGHVHIIGSFSLGPYA